MPLGEEIARWLSQDYGLVMAWLQMNTKAEDMSLRVPFPFINTSAADHKVVCKCIQNPETFVLCNVDTHVC